MRISLKPRLFHDANSRQALGSPVRCTHVLVRPRVHSRRVADEVLQVCDMQTGKPFVWGCRPFFTQDCGLAFSSEALPGGCYSWLFFLCCRRLNALAPATSQNFFVNCLQTSRQFRNGRRICCCKLHGLERARQRTQLAVYTHRISASACVLHCIP